MLRGQDVLILVGLLSSEPGMQQRQLAERCAISLSETNKSLKRLEQAGLYNPISKRVIVKAAQEFLTHAVKYFFPAIEGPVIQGIPTGIGAKPIRDHLSIHPDALIPVWPSVEGTVKGAALEPIYPSVPKIIKNQFMYETLALIDVIRAGSAREQQLAVELINERLAHEQ